MLPFLILLLLAIAIFYCIHKVQDEALQLAITLSALCCLLLSLVIAPWTIKLLLTVVLIIRPVWIQQHRIE